MECKALRYEEDNSFQTAEESLLGLEMNGILEFIRG
jgi:hypothetical protein